MYFLDFEKYTFYPVSRYNKHAFSLITDAYEIRHGKLSFVSLGKRMRIYDKWITFSIQAYFYSSLLLAAGFIYYKCNLCVFVLNIKVL